MCYGMEVQRVVGRLASLQRSACLAITGAVSSTPTAALNCSLNLTPLDKIHQGNGMISRQGKMVAYHLQLNRLWHLLGGHDHTRITPAINGSLLLV